MSRFKKFSRHSRRAVLCVFVALSVSCATTPEPSPLNPKPALRQQTVAILPFANNSIGNAVETQGLSFTLPESIGTRLIGAPDIRLLDRESIDNVLTELSLSSGALSAEAGRLQLGKMLGVQYLILGEYSAFMGSLRLDARIVEVERGTIIGAKSVEGRVKDRDNMEQELSDSLSALLFDKLGFATRPSAAVPVTSRDYFRKGFAAEQQNRLEEALFYYQKSLVLDENHEDARSHMENLLLLMVD